MAAADRLLTDDNAQRYGAGVARSRRRTPMGLYFGHEGQRSRAALLERIEAVAAQLGDELLLGVWRGG